MKAFLLETLSEEICWFRDGEFTVICKEIASLRFTDETDPVFQSIISQKCRKSAEHFNHLAKQLDAYIIENIRRLDTDNAIIFFIRNLNEIKLKIEDESSELALEEKVWGTFNQDAERLGVVFDDYIDYETGEIAEIIKKDIEGVPVIIQNQDSIYWRLFWVITSPVIKVLERNINVGMKMTIQEPTALPPITDIRIDKITLPPKPPPPKYLCLLDISDAKKAEIINIMYSSFFPELISIPPEDFKIHFKEIEGDYDKIKWGNSYTSLKLFFKNLSRERIITNSNINQILFRHFKGINTKSLAVVGAPGRATRFVNYKIEYETFVKIKKLIAHLKNNTTTGE